LRERLGFKGYVMSDWGATHSTSVAQGLDQEMGFDSHNRFFNVKHLKEYPDEVDQSMMRMFTQFFKMGFFEQIPEASRNMSSNVTTPESKNLAKELSQEGTVLLKNDNNILPLKFNDSLEGVLVLGGGSQAHDPVTHGSGSG